MERIAYTFMGLCLAFLALAAYSLPAPEIVTTAQQEIVTTPLIKPTLTGKFCLCTVLLFVPFTLQYMVGYGVLVEDFVQNVRHRLENGIPAKFVNICIKTAFEHTLCHGKRIRILGLSSLLIALLSFSAVFSRQEEAQTLCKEIISICGVCLFKRLYMGEYFEAGVTSIPYILAVIIQIFEFHSLHVYLRWGTLLVNEGRLLVRRGRRFHED